MKHIKLTYFLICGAIFFALNSCVDDETQTVTTRVNLVLDENFDVDGAPNPNLWAFDVGRGPLNDGWGNNELQYYTDRSDNAIVQNGVLIITAKAENFENASYTSARLKTRNLFEQQYGRFEARIKLPTGKGVFPAFWMLGNDFCEAQEFDEEGNVFCNTSSPLYEAGNTLWPGSGEIDIMEYIGDAPTEVFGTVHGPGFFGENSITKSYSLEGDRFDTDFHIFGIEWEQDYINWYVDDVLYSQITRADVEEEGGEWIFDKPFYMLLNLAIGGNLPGNPDGSTIFPQRMLVDYIRVYN